MENSELKKVPWMNKKEAGFFASLWQTIIQVIFTPRRFFDTLSSQPEPYGGVTFFLWTSGMLVVIRFVLNALTPEYLRNPRVLLLLGLNAVLMFALTLVIVYLLAGLLYVLGLAFRAKPGYKQALAVVSYTMPAVESFIFGLAVIGFIAAKIMLLTKAPDKAFTMLVSFMGVGILCLFVLWCVLMMLGVRRMMKTQLWQAICSVVTLIIILAVANSLLMRMVIKKTPVAEISKEMSVTEKPAVPQAPAVKK